MLWNKFRLDFQFTMINANVAHNNVWLFDYVPHVVRLLVVVFVFTAWWPLFKLTTNTQREQRWFHVDPMNFPGCLDVYPGPCRRHWLVGLLLVRRQPQQQEDLPQFPVPLQVEALAPQSPNFLRVHGLDGEACPHSPGKVAQLHAQKKRTLPVWRHSPSVQLWFCTR